MKFCVDCFPTYWGVSIAIRNQTFISNKKNPGSISWLIFCQVGFQESIIAKIVIWLCHHSLQMVTSSLESFVRSCQWKFECYLLFLLWQFLLKSLAKRLHMLCLGLFEKSFTKCDRKFYAFKSNCYKVWQKNYYKVWRSLQVETEFMAKCDRYFKVWQEITRKVWQVPLSVNIITKWDVLTW